MENGKSAASAAQPKKLFTLRPIAISVLILCNLGLGLTVLATNARIGQVLEAEVDNTTLIQIVRATHKLGEVDARFSETCPERSWLQYMAAREVMLASRQAGLRPEDQAIVLTVMGVRSCMNPMLVEAVQTPHRTRGFGLFRLTASGGRYGLNSDEELLDGSRSAALGVQIIHDIVMSTQDGIRQSASRDERLIRQYELVLQALPGAEEKQLVQLTVGQTYTTLLQLRDLLEQTDEELRFQQSFRAAAARGLKSSFGTAWNLIPSWRRLPALMPSATEEPPPLES